MKEIVVRRLLDVFVDTPSRKEWISRYLARKLRNDVTSRMLAHGAVQVMAGGFAGLRVPKEIATRNFSATQILGIYEQPVVEYLLNTLPNRRRFVDIGCGAGYFTNGIAMKYDIEVIGFDIDPSMVRQANLIRDLNGLSRVRHVQVDKSTRYNDLIQEDDLVLVDIEGAEYCCLLPDKFPNLALADYIIELHAGDQFDETSGKLELAERFAKTHQASTIRQGLKLDYNEELFKSHPWLTNYMYHACAFEYRRIPQDWLVLER